MSVTKKAADAYDIFKKAKKVKDYGSLVKGAVDEDTRSGNLFKLGIKGSVDIAGKLLGGSLSSHPYFTYHKAHFEVLAQALNASSNLDQAQAALTAAVKSADATATIERQLAGYTGRKNTLKLSYVMYLAGPLDILRTPNSPDSIQQMRELNWNPASLRANVETNMYEWRALWCELYADALQLLTMAYAELRATEEAWARFQKKMKAMSQGGNIGKIAAYRAEQDRQWMEFDRMTKPSSGDSRAVEDPAKYAREKFSSIETATNNLGFICEFVLTDGAYDSQRTATTIGNR